MLAALAPLAPEIEPTRGVGFVGGGTGGGVGVCGAERMRLESPSFTLWAALSREVEDWANVGRTFSRSLGVKGNKSSGQMVKNSSIHRSDVNCMSWSKISPSPGW